MAGPGDAAVQRGRLSGVGLPDQRDARQPEPAHDVGRAVGRAVVHHDHLDRARVAAGDHGAHGRGDARCLVVGGNHDGYAGRVDRRSLRIRRIRRVLRVLRVLRAGRWPHVCQRPGRRRRPAVPALMRDGEPDEQQQAGHDERARRDEHDRQQADRAIGRLLSQHQHVAHETLPGGRWHVPGGQAEPAGHRREAVPAGTQPRDDLRERRHRLRPVPAAVVEHDDRALAAARHRSGDDPVNPRPGPVLGVEIGEDQQVAVPARLPGRAPVCRGERVRLA